jgi:hypothetical protein
MNIERTISIRKTIHIVEGRIFPASTCGTIYARDISCTVNVDVPVLDSLPLSSFDERVAAYCKLQSWDVKALTHEQCMKARGEAGFAFVEIEAYLREHRFGPDDEIGLLARALPERCRFRLQDDVSFYVRPERALYDALYAAVERGEQVLLGVDVNGRCVQVSSDTPVVVRVRDILPDYELQEDDG